MRKLCLGILIALCSASPLSAKVVVFSEPAFPVLDSQPVSTATLSSALGPDTVFAGIDLLKQREILKNANLLVLPYGSAVPVDVWGNIEDFLGRGGNLLVLGGQPLRVPVSGSNGKFTQETAQDTFSRSFGFRHSYALPALAPGTHFVWREGYDFLPNVSVKGRRFFAVEGRLNGLGYLLDGQGDRVAAPVIFADHAGAGPRDGGTLSARIVALDFDPEPGYWDSPDGISLIRSAASFARGAQRHFGSKNSTARCAPASCRL